MSKIRTDTTLYDQIRAARAKSDMPGVSRRMYEMVEGFVTGIQAAIAKDADKIFDSAGISRDKKGNLLSALILRNLNIKLEVASPFFAELFSAQPGIKNTLVRNIRNACFLSENSHSHPRIKPDTNIERIIPAFLDDILQKDALQVLRKYANSLGINLKEVERFIEKNGREKSSHAASAAALRNDYSKIDSEIKSRVSFETYLEIRKFISLVDTESLRSGINEILKSYWRMHTAEYLVKKARGKITRAIAAASDEIKNEEVKRIFSKKGAKEVLIKMIINNRFMPALETREKFVNVFLSEIQEKYPDVLISQGESKDPVTKKKRAAGRSLTAAKNGGAFEPASGKSSLEIDTGGESGAVIMSRESAPVRPVKNSRDSEKAEIVKLALEVKKEKKISGKNPGKDREMEIVYFLRNNLSGRYTTTEIHIFANHIERYYDAIKENALPEDFVSGVYRILKTLRAQPSGGIPRTTEIRIGGQGKPGEAKPGRIIPGK